MIETSHNARIRAAYQKAHTERAQAFTALLRKVFAIPHVPLSQPALTELSR